MKELAVEVACRINSNAHAVTDPEDEAKVWGFGLFTLTSMINHSCAPNCVFVGVPDATRGGVCMQVRTISPVETGGELSVSAVGRSAGQYMVTARIELAISSRAVPR